MASVVLMSDALTEAVATGVVLKVAVPEEYAVEIVRSAMFVEHDRCHRNRQHRGAGEV